ncbi:hypothetical protein BJY00DRAFT_180645 [Aspergillus carlsbadensis]|nr:hypothetical protein BJY00DRAFT_180645 [Aspergillus carlsbadensis]
MQQEQTAETLLAVILRQVIEQCSFLPDSVREMYPSYKSNKARPSSSDILSTLCMISRNHARLFVIIDALDECLDSTWKPLLRSMRQLQQETGSSLMVTSRPNEVRRREFSRDTQLEIRAQGGDVESFLRGQLGGLSDCVVEDPTLQVSIIKQITQLADGMFLLAKLHLESLRGKRTRGHVEEVMLRLQLQVKGHGALQSAYENALERIDSLQSDDRAWATSVISWVVHARRPLKVQELQHALAVRTGNRELHPDYIPALSALCEILSLCAGLVTLSRDHTVVESCITPLSNTSKTLLISPNGSALRQS